MKRQATLMAALVAVAFVAGVSVNANCGGFDKRMAWGYRALHWSKLAGEATDNGLAAWQRAETKRCLAAHGSKTPGYAKCIAKSLAIMQKWDGCKKGEAAKGKYCKGGAAVGLQNAQKIGLNSLETAWAAKKGDVFGAVKPAVCTIAGFLQFAKDAGANFGKADKSISTLLSLSKAICK